MKRKVLFKLMLGTLLCPALAFAWPDQPVTLLVPFPPGGVTDITARIVAQRLEKNLGTTIVVENKAGAGGNIGAAMVARAKTDGYTLLYGTQGVLAANPFLYKKISFDVKKDFAPIGLTYQTAHVLAVSPKLGVKTTEEFISLAKEQPDKLTYGSSGVGGGSHLFMAYFVTEAGIQMLHVPYKGGGPAMTDLLGGRLNAMLDSIPSAAVQIKSGKLLALGVSGATRDPEFPETPTLAESGVPGFEAVSWGALVAPQGTPDDILQKLSISLKKTLEEPETKRMLAERGARVLPSSREEAAAKIDEEMRRWSAVIKKMDIKLD